MMDNQFSQTVEEMVEDLIRERHEFKTGAIERSDLLASANHAGKAFKGISLMLANAEMRGEVPNFAILRSREGEGFGPISKPKRLGAGSALALSKAQGAE